MRLRSACMGLLCLATVPLESLAADITQARLWTDTVKTRLVLELTESVTPTVFELSDPLRLVVDVPEATAVYGLTDQLDLMDSPIAAVRTGEHNKMSRIVLDLKAPVEHKHFLLAPNQGQPYRLVLDLTEAAGGETEGRSNAVANNQQLAQIEAGRDIIIVVDAGHGGKDPGAIGASGTYEKDVVLAIAKKLEERLDATPGFEGELTRKDDTFLSLRERTRIARDLSADFFVSIHADAATRKSAQGSSIYALSTSGASSETARWLASRENNALLSGEDDHIALADADPLLRSVLLDLAMGVTLTDSLTAGSRIIDSLGLVNRLHKPSVEQAGFVVLKSPDIPSLLVETGFITNAEEELRLKNPEHQDKLTTAILNGLVGHFQSDPPSGTWLAQQQTNSRNGEIAATAHVTGSRDSAKANYQIQAGDTLTSISEATGIPLEALRAVNPVDQLPLQAGAILQLPEGRGASAKRIQMEATAGR